MTDRPDGRLEAAGEQEPRTDVRLEDVTEVETVSDVVDVAALSRRLPGDWEVAVDVVPFGREPLAEVLVITRRATDVELLLKPVELSDPSGRVEYYERGQGGGEGTQILTTDSLEEAVRVATNRTHQLTG